MPANWTDVLLAYLHDPPDKALSVTGPSELQKHVHRRFEFIKALLDGDDAISKKAIQRLTGEADKLASIVERLPMPETPVVNVVDNRLQVRHPLSGAAVDLNLPELTTDLLDAEKQRLIEACKISADGTNADRNRLFAIWRRWGNLLAGYDSMFSRLPAETRNPDHTIWNHLDTTAAFQAATGNRQQPALLAFALGPVQQFIEASRSVRDLWSSSMILSWLAFRSMLPVVEELGPTALIYPSLRGNPLLDLWLRKNCGQNDLFPNTQLRMTPCLPHRFLALVPWGENGTAANKLAQSCRQAMESAWSELACEVKNTLNPEFGKVCKDWSKRWSQQIDAYFHAETSVVPLSVDDDDNDDRLAALLSGKATFAEAFPGAESVREMIRKVSGRNYRQDHAGRWQYHVELTLRSMAAQRSVRHVPANRNFVTDNGHVPQKCSLLGSYEQMGPDDLGESRKFWDRAAQDVSVDGVRIRSGEALSAVALVKRFAAPAFLRQQLELQQPDSRFPDTYTIAAAEWLERAKIHWDQEWRNEHGKVVPWNGQWLHWPNRDQNSEETAPCPAELFMAIQDARSPKKLGDPPIYYAILKLDGDDLGSWLRGENEKSPTVRDVMHPDLVSYYEGLGDIAHTGLDARRPVGPALHAAISSALTNFALHAVPAIVARHRGTTIYSGGDDTLVLLPTNSALACASELRQAYSADWYTSEGQDYLMMGARATISGGMVVVHAKDDLRLALQDARASEKVAKEAGKDALCVRVRRRSGEHTSAICSWSFAETVNGWTQAFFPKWDAENPTKVLKAGASDRWAYHLHSLESTLAGLPDDAIAAEIRRQINRAEPATRSRLGEPSKPEEQETAGAILSQAFLKYRDMMKSRQQSLPENQRKKIGPAIRGFMTLCQTASFLARGRDQ